MTPPSRDGARSVNEWHPMATAPRDGTQILIWTGRECVCGEFHEFADGTAIWEIGQENGVRIGLQAVAKAWQPLPPPPVGAEQAIVDTLVGLRDADAKPQP